MPDFIRIESPAKKSTSHKREDIGPHRHKGQCWRKQVINVNVIKFINRPKIAANESAKDYNPKPEPKFFKAKLLIK
ncbi:hypothetical protein [Fibrobacter succinogenes]|uniref:hypothetical protein n=1 Tax=Fibrobacter succinogenes TaxID=833 RepID=UPI001569B940|nr:hypothetical protein [Fibrobacter succinogenes]